MSSSKIHFIQPRCPYGHVCSKTILLEALAIFRRYSIPEIEIHESLGISGETRKCCANIFQTSVSTEEKPADEADELSS
jgi:hypothetical protein